MITILQRCLVEQVRLGTSGSPLGKLIDQRTPPVVWFGELFSPNSGFAKTDFTEKRSDKEIILTVGANPSWREFHDKQGGRTLLTGSKQRLPLLPTPYPVSGLMISQLVDIMKGFNDYFKINPFVSWFGRASRVEAFLNGMGASYYGGYKYQAIHIDLFPFSTCKNYTSIVPIVNNVLMKSGWAPAIFRDIVNFIKPARIVVFGKSNYDALRRYMDPALPALMSIPSPIPHCNNRYVNKVRLWGKYDLVGLSCNLGNPIGLASANLKLWGSMV